ncbi:arginyltransferase [Komagataeibacter sp. AV436]|uniref:Aspartate/glutamate leucyltransferase n=1 Tax=Komagataeibacter melomenusus TaxID=2766578 RepID=A0ABX2A8W9_9PROT|nr:arginyltransferase [Komagataeibacter melomenusus]MBV1829350.1 arginyltransferase [Komagataeibacter melomenusus]NPC64921.1 arginyltransferase [Komagataeibacter melomenusus]
MTYTSPRHPQLFYTTAPMPCPYLPGRMERKVVTEIGGPEAVPFHNRLSRAGFRRSHTIAYAPVCANCTACTPIRVPVARFAPGRTQRRVLARNKGLCSARVPPHATPEQFNLFSAYQATRHDGGDMASMTFPDYRAMIEDTTVETFMIEFRDAAARLVCVALVDQLDDGLSAVYDFFEPGMPARSLGTFAVLQLIEYTRALGLPYLYLGYWISESHKMAYKARFRPAQIMTRGVWHDLDLSQPDAAQPQDSAFLPDDLFHPPQPGMDKK